MGVDFKTKNIQIDGKGIKLQLWDTAGQERFRTIKESYYKGAFGICLVNSVSDRKSFYNISNDALILWQMDEADKGEDCKQRPEDLGQ